MKFSELLSELAEKYTVLSKQIVKDGNVYYIDKVIRRMPRKHPVKMH